MPGNTNPRIKPDINIKIIEKEVLVYDPATEKIHIINRTAGDILNLCDGANDLVTIKKKISALYEMDDNYDDICRDVDEMMDKFRELDILIPDEPAADLQNK